MVVDTIMKHKCLADVLDSQVLVQVIQPRTSQYNMLWVTVCKNDLYVKTCVNVAPRTGGPAAPADRAGPAPGSAAPIGLFNTYFL